MSRILRAELGWAAAAFLAACHAGDPGVLNPAGPAGERIARLGWFMIVLAAVIFAGVVLIQILAVRRHHQRDPAAVDLMPQGHAWPVWGGGVMPAVVLAVLFLAGTAALGRFPASSGDSDLTVRVTGLQWWWRLEYVGRNSAESFVTANELHVPVGRTVRLELTSADVIHSFWVPALQGKLDLVPGDTNELRISAERPGSYGGRCAEYCGQQHAHMALTVIAQSPADFEKWAASQRAPSREPSDSEARAGQQLVVSGACALCHTIRGTDAGGQVAPDLTHLASRRSLAAGTVPNTPGYLEAWITNAPSLKPGTRMPALPQFTGRELREITAYLRTLN